MLERCCGTCRYWELEEIDVGHVCVNDRSEYCTEWVEEDDVCLKWEEREHADGRRRDHP